MKRNAVAWAALVVSCAALIGSRSYIQAVPAAQEVPAEGQKAAKALSEAFEAVADFVRPSVVQISIEKRAGLRRGPNGRAPGLPDRMDPKDLEELLKRFFGPGSGFKFEREQFGVPFVQTGTGSGFVYDTKGHILTNNHVVEGADKIEVTFWDGVKLPAKVVGRHPETDVAVIKVDSTEYRPLPRGESKKLRVGEWVLAVGSPFGLSQTVTAGIISATGRKDLEINQFEEFIQTDAAINPGNSGGPLVNMEGRVIGVNSAIATGSSGFGGVGANAGVGFAIPIDMAARLADKLIKEGKVNPGLIGVMVEPLTRSLARQIGVDPKTQGVLVMEVTKGSPAEKAGLKQGDIITHFDGNPVSTRKSLQYLVQTSDIGKSYELRYLRNGKEHIVTLAPAPLDQVIARERRERPSRESEEPARESQREVNDFGIAVEPLTPELARKYGYPEGTEGLVITEVKEGSPAYAEGLEVGDVISKIVKDKKFQDVRTVEDFNAVANHADEIAVYVHDVNHRLPPGVKTLAKPKK
ncbi:MAG: trypsin-like peptidase domain-containing protein [Isosphaeraceae bacterium]|nr:trypsin-like peptidase domain-containing protein [Isosphaeraceae bacterium]